MATDATGMTRVNHEKLIRFVSRSFEKLGVPPVTPRSPPMSWWRPICAASIPMA